MWFPHFLVSFLNQKISFLMFVCIILFFGMNILMVWLKKKKKKWRNKTFIRVHQYMNMQWQLCSQAQPSWAYFSSFSNVGALSITSSRADFIGLINERGPQTQLNRPFGPKLHEPRTFLLLLIFMSCTSIDKKP